jgi:hypothetical protein
MTGFQRMLRRLIRQMFVPPNVIEVLLGAEGGLMIQTALNRMSGMRSLYVRPKTSVKIMDTAVPELQQVPGDKQMP